MLRGAPEQPANVRLTGLRGVGKTVLLGEFQKVAEEQEWACAFLELQPTTESRVSTLTPAEQDVCSQPRNVNIHHSSLRT